MKVEGCDAMCCGQDYHGGNQQAGCGHRFSWTSAPKYVAQVDSRPLPKVTAEEVRRQSAFHPFVDCCLCDSRGIKGPRFRCIHCQAFDVCLQCEPQLARRHAADHVFEVMMESDFSWAAFHLPEGTRVQLLRCEGNLVQMQGSCGVIIGPGYRLRCAGSALSHPSQGHVLGGQVAPGSLREAAAAAALRRANASKALPDSGHVCHVLLDDGREVQVLSSQVEPILQSRGEAEVLVAQSLSPAP